jgi:hypothetical protein
MLFLFSIGFIKLRRASLGFCASKWSKDCLDDEIEDICKASYPLRLTIKMFTIELSNSKILVSFLLALSETIPQI